MASKVLVLNQDYQAISVCSAERAFVLVFLNKAELISNSQTRTMRTVSAEFAFPSIIRLNRYINLPYKKVALSRSNISSKSRLTVGSPPPQTSVMPSGSEVAPSSKVRMSYCGGTPP